MSPEAKRLHELAARASRRAFVAASLQCLAAGAAVAAMVARGSGVNVAALAGLAAAALVWIVLIRGRRTAPVTAPDFARHLDALRPELEDSSHLLLEPRDGAPGLVQLQRANVAAAFARLDDTGHIENALPPFALGRVAVAWGVAVSAVVIASFMTRDAPPTLEASAGAALPAIESVNVSLQPPGYLGLPARETGLLDIETYEGTSVEWALRLDQAAATAAFVLHDGTRIELAPDGRRAWRAGPWPARSTVYRLLVDEREIPNGIFRLDARPDEAPRLRVSEPVASLRVLPAGPAQDLRLRLAFEARDDHGIVDAMARVTLARGSGEQVRFREEAVPVAFDKDKDGLSIRAEHEFDLLALGMEPGDEMYVFAQAIDNRPGEPNVGSSGTYIVRWPDEDAVPSEPVATMTVSVLPEYFRSQRQIIIDTERLLGERDQLDEPQFAQRAQTLAADQKLLRLRYGQFLGEEDDSGIGPATEASMARGRDDEEHQDENELEDHDHAGHASQPPGDVRPGDAQAAIELYGHFHDREEQSTLFDPETTGLLKAALAQMWQAELELRLARPRPALPFEYAALDYIKRVQQSSRIYLRRTGFRPTPVDEDRRLTGELDDFVSATRESDTDTAGDRARMRALLAAMTERHEITQAIATQLAELEPILASRASTDAAWLPALGAIQRLIRDSDCADCRAELVAELWRGIDVTLAAPTARSDLAHPLARAYRRQQRQTGADNASATAP